MNTKTETKKQKRDVSGWINFYKPREMGSTDAVHKIRSILSAKKAGHAGTLDPLAEGILPIALGEATKTISYIQSDIKTYECDIVWGEARSTDDMEGEVTETSDHRPTQLELENILPQFTGNIDQIPPKYSAIKINGERAYALARKGEEVELKPRPVFIESIEVLSHNNERTTLKVVCGKGTYIRSLGRDMALKLGTFGYIDNLKRTKVGNFDLNNVIFLDKLEEFGHKDSLDELLMPVDAGLADIPVLNLSEAEALKLKQGQVLSFVSRGDSRRLEPFGNEKDVVRAYHRSKLMGLVTIHSYRISPLKMFNL